MSKIKRVALIASITTASLGVVGCSSTASTNTQNNTTQNDTTQNNTRNSSGVPVTLFAPEAANVSNMKTNWFTKYAEKNFHLNITWNLVPQADLKTKQNLLVESGNYPDVFWNASFTAQQVLEFGKEGVFQPLNSLIKKYAPNVWKAIQTNAAFKQAVVTPGGKIYSLPYYNVCTHCNWSSKMWINGYWLKKLNLPLPTTTTQFEQVLEAFKKHNLIPLTGYTDGWNSNPVPFLMDAFIYDDNKNYFNLVNGKVTFAADKPQWKAGLAYIHDLHQKGLLDASAFTQKSAQLKTLISKNKVGAAPGGVSPAFPGASGVPWQYWMNAVPPLKGPNGSQYATFYGNIPSGASFAITKKASKAQAVAVLKLVNFLYTFKGLQMANWGPAGNLWTHAKQGQKGLSGQQAYGVIKPKSFNLTQQNEGWNQDFPMYQDSEERNNSDVASPPYTASGSQSLLRLITEEDYAGHQPKQVYPGQVWMPTSVAKQFALEQTNINDYVKTWTTNFILGRKSLKTDWGQYVKGLNGLGLDQYLKTAQTYMGSPFSTSSFVKHQHTIKYLLSLPEKSSAVKWVVTPSPYAKYESWKNN